MIPDGPNAMAQYPGRSKDWWRNWQADQSREGQLAKWLYVGLMKELNHRFERIEAQLERIGAPDAFAAERDKRAAAEEAYRVRMVAQSEGARRLSEMGISTRVANALSRQGIYGTEPIDFTKAQSIRNIGKKGLEELRSVGLLKESPR